ncbi:class I poly(R)-hydroxyalkanoic acid synthase [Thalassorhabdomicrobium marinisediminis]|uniref:Class I poly(R)-hydroxyalkanoic acid synthase n=1 Tax=Thalassorhabdomicrobium marinisediminis TaxID=2170577 RepID=A0A2T7FXU0_9RHOB|nr:class I poly(R)-hydroxyalkanoic acid synthase [Thalassorhabdomicrobium marinisediminis]PVA06948.1 class I poly(R)-hydroxyalkanoic acid synthase [Thalassorhabdomicrobium marinisediminis]
MTTDGSGKTEIPIPDAALSKLEANTAKIQDLTTRLMAMMANKRTVPVDLQAPAPDLYAKAQLAYWQDMVQNPAKLIEQQVGYWGQTLQHFVEAQQALASGKLEAPEDRTPGDRRFKNPLWQTHPYFNFLKQQYLRNAEAVEQTLSGIEGLAPEEKKRLEYFSGQIIDMLSPTNFLATNPDALTKAVETEGESLVRGLENMIADMEANDGELVVSLADKDAFTVGENIATSEGEVVFRNHLFELIQYAPTTEQVHKTPLIIFPPWINKFYILDLKEQNSLIKWIVDQGVTLIVVSWVNPDASYRETGMTDYVEDGYITAFETVREICGVKKVNAVGYCIAGTTLSLSLSVMKQRGLDYVNSATFFTTLTDFSDRGEVGVFLEDDFVDGIENEVERSGYLDKFYMSRTFSYLRSNDLIYQPAIRSYMMGEAPPAFDLLYWNGDGTNLPAKMAVEYLRGLCQQDKFAGEGFEVAGHLARIEEVDVPLCAIACESDHIAAWKSSYRGVQKMGATDKTFILSGSGHIAGIVNPPAKKKYGHWTNDDLSLPPEAWKAAAKQHEGSWWPRWGKWLAKRSGKKVEARAPGSETHPPIAPAPGKYVVNERI